METPSGSYCFILLRPESVLRRLIGVMIAEIESVDCAIVRMEFQQPDAYKIKQLYCKPELDEWRKEIIESHLRGPVVAILVDGGSNICHQVSLIVKNLRKTYGIDRKQNGIHSSDDSLAAIREARIFFKDLPVVLKS